MIDCMKTENYFAEKKRMIKRAGIGVCRIKCEDCPLGITNNGMDVLCSELETLYPEKAIEIIQEWSNAHPPKTYLTELLKNFPNTPLEDDGSKPNHATVCDMQEVKHGKWEEIRDAYGQLEGWIHIGCGREVKIKENYCPNCGAKMDR